MKYNKTIIERQLKALAIYDFLKMYYKLEDKIKGCFKDTLNDLPKSIKNKLYFYYGGRIGSFISYETEELQLNKLKFNENEQFGAFSVNQILKINKENCFVAKFSTTINSIQRKMVNYNSIDCMIKVLDMRNVLAHKIEDINFTDKHIIETLTIESIKSNIDIKTDLDLQYLDNTSLQIYSNIVYMKILLSKLDDN